MKKLFPLLLVLVMCVSLVACGGPDKQPAIDEFNEASTAFDALVAIINKDIESYPDEVIEVMVETVTLIRPSPKTLWSSGRGSRSSLRRRSSPARRRARTSRGSIPPGKARLRRP